MTLEFLTQLASEAGVHRQTMAFSILGIPSRMPAAQAAINRVLEKHGLLSDEARPTLRVPALADEPINVSAEKKAGA